MMILPNARKNICIFLFQDHDCFFLGFIGAFVCSEGSQFRRYQPPKQLKGGRVIKLVVKKSYDHSDYKRRAHCTGIYVEEK